MRKVYVIKSGTWMDNSKIDNYQDEIDRIVSDFLKDSDKIINIEKQEKNGLHFFYMYIEGGL